MADLNSPAVRRIVTEDGMYRSFGPPIDTLGGIRTVIDDCDERIVKLLAIRGNAVYAATVHKRTIEDIPQLHRQADVIRRTNRLAEKQGCLLPGFSELVRTTYGVLVPGYVALQESVWKQTVPVSDIK